MRLKQEFSAFAFLWMLVGGAISLGMANAAWAQAVNLDALGIGWNFESPDVDAANDGAEQASNLNLGPGWTYNLLAGAGNNFGVQDPADGYYGVHPLAAPFSGRQIGFFNLDAFSVGEVVSRPVGALVAGQTYTLNVAVGARNNATWSNVRYAIGLRTTGDVALGTFATVDLDPGSGPTIISDLQYSLNVNSQAPGFVGQEVEIVIRAINLGTGIEPLPPAFTQANFDNVRLNGTLAAANSPIITINRNTGAITLSKTGTTNLNISGYSLTSTNGSFNPATWSSVANTYDKASAPTPGNGSVDNNDAWTILGGSATANDLSEAELETGGDGGTLSHTSAINLGAAWLRTPVEDVAARISLGDGSTIDALVQYSGTAIPSGDLTGDGNITGLDWTAFKNGQGTNFTGLSDAAAYLKGDLDGDGDHDLADFVRFRDAYELFNGGAGSFAAMLSSVPEPSSCLLLLLAVLAGSATFGRSASRRHIMLLLAVAVVAASSSPANAQSVVSHWSFDTGSLTTDGGGNITGAADSTGNHNAAVIATGLGGANGMTNISAPFAGTDSVAGQFGQALRFNGNNFMAFPNFTELMAASGGPSFSVSMWVQWLSGTAPGGATPFATLGDWGNAAADSGVANQSSRFTYAFGPVAASSIRSQTRRNNEANGNGDDVWAITEVVPTPVNDGSWHMLTWTLNTTSGVMNTYYDGAHLDDDQSGDPVFALANSTSPFGTMGLKGDNSMFLTADTRLDEVRVYEGILDGAQVLNLFECNDLTGNNCPLTKLRATVNTGNGEIIIDNPTDAPIILNAYTLSSVGNSLDEGDWDPISGQTIAGFPTGDGSGNGWEAGAAPNPNQLAEYRLIGDSTFGSGATINLGNAFDDLVGIEDIKFQYTLDDGSIVNGHVFYESASVLGDYNEDGIVNAADYTVWRDNLGAPDGSLPNRNPSNSGPISQADYTYWKSRFGMTSGSGSGAAAVAVPEPTTELLVMITGCALLCYVSCVRRQRALAWSIHRPAVGYMAVVVCCLANVASAAYTVDRIYHFGDDANEDASAGIAVGTGPSATVPNVTRDSMGPSGSFIHLAPNGATGLPTYINVGVTGPDLAQVRPGAPAGNLGIKFDGVDDFLNGLRFAYPHNAPGTHLYPQSPAGPNNYDGVNTLGFQLWVYPNSAGSALSQHVVMDSRQHGLRTNTQGEWALVYGNTEVDSNVDIVFNQWAHVMVAMPGTLPNREVLYVNGVAIAARQANYTSNVDPVAGELVYALTVGANTSNTDPLGTTNRFNGVLDELEMFVWGSTYNAGTDTFTNLGKFNFGSDNDFASGALTGIAGDVNQSGTFTQADVDDFVAGWLTEKRVNNVRVGDVTTILTGDLNFDGITDLLDLPLLRDAISGAGSGGGFDLTALNALGVPEPSTVALSGAAIGAGLACRRRRTGKIRMRTSA